MELVRRGRLDLMPLLTHIFGLEGFVAGYELFSEKRKGVIQAAIKP